MLGGSGTAAALSFGAMQVQSALNQPLRAQVWLNGTATPAESLDVHMASAARFADLGVRRSALIDRIHIETQPDGNRVRVTLTTQRPVDEPFVNFVLEAVSGGGSSLHEYTALLDPAEGDRRAVSGSAAYGAPANNDSRSAGNAARVLPPIPHSAHATGDRAMRHRVTAGETLWTIAGRRAPPGISVSRAAWAIYQANPGAFGSGPGVLRQGAILNIPAAARMRDVSTDAATSRLAAASGGTTSDESRVASNDAAATRASGQSPPPPDRMVAASRDDRSSTAEAASSGGGTPVEISAADETATFGTLMLPEDRAWPTSTASQGTPDGAEAAADNATAGATSAAGPMANTPDGASDMSASSLNAPTIEPSTSTASDTSSTGTSNNDATEESTLFGTRNLLLLLVLLLIAFAYVRRRQQRAPAVSGAAGQPTAGATRARTAGEASTSAATSDTGQARAEPPLRDEPAWLVSAATPSRHERAKTTSTTADEAGPETYSDIDDGADSNAPHDAGSDTHDETRDAVPSAEYATPETSASPASAQVSALAETGQETPAPDAAQPSADADTPAAESGPGAPRERDPTVDFEPAPFESRPRMHDAGTAEPGLDFDAGSTAQETTSSDPEISLSSTGSAASTESAEPADASENAAWPDTAADAETRIETPSRYGLEMIDPGEFDLYDAGSPNAETPDESDDQDSLQIRLDLARMYIDMDDVSAARELAEDVRARGDESQRATAERLLGEIAAR
ncbi:FimV/HubP family polar landmark protein [Salinisphaera sp. Q1T1-3]|uniref:FimV/HubP family polar landmark protein n=1 Tax=Salinisphaera sp. Q1T1-3 TaxID=2321229 RepID=UPI001313E863|nr:FimV/HubP family polar landmark protein [Salinisphaera sp. Q1T1-3]